MSNGIGKHHAKTEPASKPAVKTQAPAARLRRTAPAQRSSSGLASDSPPYRKPRAQASTNPPVFGPGAKWTSRSPRWHASLLYTP